MCGHVRADHLALRAAGLSSPPSARAVSASETVQTFSESTSVPSMSQSTAAGLVMARRASRATGISRH